MMIVSHFLEHVEELFEAARIPSVEALRPTSCPLCGELACSPGKPLGIVGHGTYRRQVLGVEGSTGELVTIVRRYLCRGCKRTISILSDHLHPRRWYAAGSILEALRLHLMEGASEREIRSRFAIVTDSESWRSLRRWRSELVVSLWHWLCRRLGFRREAASRQDGRRRLRRVFSEAGEATKPDSVKAACSLLRCTVHFQGDVWAVGHDPPENLKVDKPL